MLSVSIISFLSLIMAFLTPQPVARVDRLYWDHVEGFCLADSVGREIYAGSRNRLYYSSDFGQSWTHLGDLPKVTLIRQIIPDGRGTIFIIGANTWHGECYVSLDSGRTFCERLDSTGANNCAYYDSQMHRLFVVSEVPFQLLYSDDSGSTWFPEGDTIDDIRNPHACSLLVRDEPLGKAFYISTSVPATIYCMTETENTWRKCFRDRQNLKRELPLVTMWGKKLVACIATGLFISHQEIYVSDDKGVTWRTINCPFDIWGAGFNASDTNVIWVGNYESILKSDENISLQFSQDQGNTWHPILNCEGKLFWQLQVLDDGSLYAATDFGLMRVKRN